MLDEEFNVCIVPLILVKKPQVIAFTPYSLESNTAEKLPNFLLYNKLIVNKCLIPMEAIIIAYPHPTQVMRDEGGMLPCHPNLNVVLELVFD